MHARTWLTASCLSVSLWATGGCVERLLTDGFDEPLGDGGPGEGCGDDLDCAPGHACFEETCVGAGEFRVSLSWMEVTDLDLHVLTPDGIEISYLDPHHPFAHLDVDDCVAGRCRNEAGPHVENVFFEPHAPRGHYQVWVENFDGRRATTWTIEITGGTAGVHAGELPAEQGAQSDPIDVLWP
jgi:hypothetical protein